MMEEKVIVKRPPKSPGLAGVLAFFFPGVGALYNGQVSRFFLYVFTLASLVTMLARDIGLDVFIALMLGAFYVFQIYDAAHSARLINLRSMNQEADADIDELEQIPAVVKAGSVFWGIVLISLGVVLLLANFELVNYATLWDLLPVAVVIIGVKLIIDYIRGGQDRKGEE
jgi:TM2 domain-containing membrane protein YozV